MKLFDKLTSDNFVLFAVKNYKNIQCRDLKEFYEDLNRFKYLKKLINRFLNKEDENLDQVFRLILNHIIIIYNVFEIPATNKMMLYKFNNKHMTVIKPILLFLGYIEKKDMINISLDNTTIEYCRKI